MLAALPMDRTLWSAPLRSVGRGARQVEVRGGEGSEDWEKEGPAREPGGEGGRGGECGLHRARRRGRGSHLLLGGSAPAGPSGTQLR